MAEGLRSGSPVRISTGSPVESGSGRNMKQRFDDTEVTG